jgi:hypothetical protein
MIRIIGRHLACAFAPRFLAWSGCLLLAYAWGFQHLLAAAEARHLAAHGINAEFAVDMSHAALAALAALLGLMLVPRFRRAALSPPADDFDPGNWLFPLILAPIAANYTLSNDEILTPSSKILVPATILAAGILFLVVLPWLLRRRVPLPASIAVGTAFCVLITIMPMLSISRDWYLKGDFHIQGGIFLAIWGGILLLYPLRRQVLHPVLAVFIVGNLGAALLHHGAEAATAPPAVSVSEGALTRNLLHQPFASRPDIYLLVYDAYVPGEVMDDYGIDNSEQEGFLRDRGFTVYPETYSLGADSLGSMSRILDMSPAVNGREIQATAGNATLLRLLRAQGYQVHGAIRRYFFGPLPSRYDAVPGAPVRKVNTGYALLMGAVLEGRFRFTAGFGDAAQITRTKRLAISDDNAAPRFLYAHVGPGHSQNSGQCLPDEIDLFRRRLEDANAEMREDIDLILARGRPAVIVVMGDHGPYLFGDCTNLYDYGTDQVTARLLRDRLGAFLAIRWPEGMERETDIKTIQDVFPEILAALYGNDAALGYRMPRESRAFQNVRVVDGIVSGGPDDGQPLFGGAPATAAAP